MEKGSPRLRPLERVITDDMNQYSSNQTPGTLFFLGSDRRTWDAIRALIALLVSCVALQGADTGLQLTTTHWTNAAKTKIIVTDVYTRGGRTNLVRKTHFQDGKFALRQQMFFHDGTLLGEYSVLGTNSVSVTIQPASPYFLALEHKRSKDLQVLTVFTKGQGVVLDAFSCTNEVFTPVPDATIKSANNWPEDLERLIHTNQIDHVSQSGDQKKPH